MVAKNATKRAKDRAGNDASSKPQLVIVESPAKATTIEKYLGPGFVVKASVGHIRDLVEKAPPGSKQAVPGVDLEHDFTPSYEIVAGKNKVVTELKRLAKNASDIWFATDLDRPMGCPHLFMISPVRAPRPMPGSPPKCCAGKASGPSGRPQNERYNVKTPSGPWPFRIVG